MNFICFLVLEEELYKARERVIEISIEKDTLFDSVSGLERKLYDARKNVKKFKKKLSVLKKLLRNCICRNVILYR